MRTPEPRNRTPHRLAARGIPVLEARLPVIRRTKHLLTNLRPVLKRVRPGARGRVPRDACAALVDCPECGEGRVSPRDVTVRARIENDQWSYRFTCPTCARLTVASTSREAALEAVEAGATLETWRWSIETGGPDPDAPPLHIGDLLDLRIALSEPSWLDTLSTSDTSTSDRGFGTDPDR